jgi:hypothetical protein
MLPVLMLISSPSKLRQNKPGQADPLFRGIYQLNAAASDTSGG